MCVRVFLYVCNVYDTLTLARVCALFFFPMRRSPSHESLLLLVNSCSAHKQVRRRPTGRPCARRSIGPKSVRENNAVAVAVAEAARRTPPPPSLSKTRDDKITSPMRSVFVSFCSARPFWRLYVLLLLYALPHTSETRLCTLLSMTTIYKCILCVHRVRAQRIYRWIV